MPTSATAPPPSTHSAGATPNPELEQLAAAFFARWGVSFDAFHSSFADTMGPRCRWEQRPMLVTNTRAGALRFLRVCHRALGLETVHVETGAIASTGSTVMIERVDHLLRADGTLIASAPVAGVLEFDGSRIVAWREHFDAVSFAAQMPRRALRRRPIAG